MSEITRSPLEKYRDILVAAALFLIIDLGVLAFNYFSSHLIEADTQRIHTVGELRVFSQQLAKAVLSLRHEYVAGEPIQTSLAQLSESRQGFIEALNKLEQSGQNRNMWLENPKANQIEQHLMATLRKHWEPIERATLPVIAYNGLRQEDVDIAATLIVNRNLSLMQEAGDLSTHLESSAIERATAMRHLQLTAITLALLNFLFILFKVFRRLARSDRNIERAQQETQRILDTVHEGLFLVTADGCVGSQRSASLNHLLGRSIAEGETISAVFENRLDHRKLTQALEFIDLLFKDKLQPTQMDIQNPAQEVVFTLPDGQTKFLDFEFEQVRGKRKEVEYLLVTIFDVSRRVALERELANAKERARNEVDDLLNALDADLAPTSALLEKMTQCLLPWIETLQTEENERGSMQQELCRLNDILKTLRIQAQPLNLKIITQDITAAEDMALQLSRINAPVNRSLRPLVRAIHHLLADTSRAQSLIGRIHQRTTTGVT